MARDCGLIGFRFSSESWWTEDIVSAKEDEHFGAEVMAAHEEAGTRPMLVIVLRVKAAGIAAEVESLSKVEALLGALSLLDHVPGMWWAARAPSIPGLHREHDEDPLGPAPQTIEGRALRGDRAWSDLGVSPFPVELDIGAYLSGPAGAFLSGVPYDEVLSLACRLALHAVATWDSDVAYVLAAAAVKASMSLVQDEAAYAEKMRSGIQWRTEHESSWPTSNTHAGVRFARPDWADQLPDYEQAIAATAASPPGLDLTHQQTNAHSLLDLLQVLVFGAASSANS